MLSLIKKVTGQNGGSGQRPDRGTTPPDLAWVDGFIANIRPYVHVREADGVMIKMPNQAFHLNDTGARILHSLLSGDTVADLLGAIGPGKAADVGRFIFAVKRCLAGDLLDTDPSPAIVARPLTINFSPLPVLAEIAITDRCNLKCVFCYAGCPAGGGAGHKGQLSYAEIRRLIDRIREDAGVPSVSFTGGEPTLRSELPELVGYATGRGMRVNLITNGTLMTRELAGALASAGLASAQVSIEGTTMATHEAITGVPGSFARSVAAVGHLRRAGIHVHANTTINRINLAECVELPGFTAGLGLDKFSMNLVIPSGSAAVNTAALVRYREVGPVLAAVIAASEKHSVEFMWYSPTPLCLFNPVIHGLGNKGCSACDGLLSIDSTGAILPCSSCADPVGNLLEEEFQPLWASAKAVSYRMKTLAHPRCRDCDNFAVCHGACPLYWQHFGFDELRAARGFPAAAISIDHAPPARTDLAVARAGQRGVSG